MKKKKLIFDPSKSPKEGIYIDKDMFEFSEKTDDPDFMFDYAECNIVADKAKKRKDSNIDINQLGNGGSSSSSSSQQIDTSSISNTISSVVTPVVATVVVASTGLVPGLESLNSINVLNSGQEDIRASIVSVESTNVDVKYKINLDFYIDLDEPATLNDKDVDITLSNDFLNYEQSIQYNDTGPSEQDYTQEAKSNSKLSSKYTIAKSGQETLNDDENTVKKSFTITGFVGGLNENMNYTLNIKSKGKVLTKQTFKTKTDEEMPPFEITSSEIKIDTYSNIASFEMMINAENWSDKVKFNDEDFVIRLASNQNTVDFKISTDYNYVLKQGIDFIYDLSQNQSGGSNVITIRGDISNLAENTNYTLMFLIKNDKVAENSFVTSNKAVELESNTESN